MGTNYYLHRDVCPHCGRSAEKIHIGKSSSGWCFALVADEFKTLGEWRDAWKSGTIKNEYGEVITEAAMLSVITERNRCIGWFGYDNEAHFHRSNHSERGPNNLLRHKVDGRFCYSHGDGTWDYMCGGFS